MGKKKRDHKAKVVKRNLRQEAEAVGQWDAIAEMLAEKGYTVEEAIEKHPELSPLLLPYALKALALTNQNLKKYGNKPV